jgi:hypothetical protein
VVSSRLLFHLWLGRSWGGTSRRKLRKNLKIRIERAIEQLLLVRIGRKYWAQNGLQIPGSALRPNFGQQLLQAQMMVDANREPLSPQMGEELLKHERAEGYWTFHYSRN